MIFEIILMVQKYLSSSKKLTNTAPFQINDEPSCSFGNSFLQHSIIHINIF